MWVAPRKDKPFVPVDERFFVSRRLAAGTDLTFGTDPVGTDLGVGLTGATHHETERR
jgi:hypothetical protein